MKLLLTFILFLFCSLTSDAFEIPVKCQQLITGTTPDWNSSEVVIQRWIRSSPTQWKKVGSAWKGRIGAEGSAWGIGLHPQVSSLGPSKREGDGRAPAGVFQIGHAYGYASKVKKRDSLTYHQVTERDLWVEDSSSPYYNQHLQLTDRTPQTEWEQQAQMRLNDPAHALKLFIGHNSPPHAVPGGGSAIFFHIWRNGGSVPTSGCTVQKEKYLRTLISWVDPNQAPLYVLLPQEAYASLRGEWKLP